MAMVTLKLCCEGAPLTVSFYQEVYLNNINILTLWECIEMNIVVWMDTACSGGFFGPLNEEIIILPFW